jgi:Photosynthetic reaction centre cytochrome C subunit
MRKAFVALSMLAAIALLAQNAGPGRRRGGMPAPRNLKVIKPEEIRAVMESFVMGTGRKCLDCHVEGDFGSDENNKKVVARKMLEMVRQINTNTFNGSEKVTCYTCHRGANTPATPARRRNRIRNRLLSSAADRRGRTAHSEFSGSVREGA